MDCRAKMRSTRKGGKTPVEQRILSGAGEGNRTLVTGVAKECLLHILVVTPVIFAILRERELRKPD